MAAYRFYDPGSVFWNILGTAGLREGSVQFYEIGTTTPKNTWSNAGLSVLNANPLNIDASGRFPDDVFLDGEYTIVLYDGLNGTGATVWTRDVISGAGAGTEIPAPTIGFVLSSADGVNLVWVDPDTFLPDPTGQTGKALVSTGVGYTFQAFPEAPELDVVVTANSFRAGDGVSTTKFLEQWGTDSAPATGTSSTTKAIVFTTAFTTIPVVHPTPTSSSQPGGPVVAELTSVTTTGFTVKFDVAEGSSSGSAIVNPVPFGWSARGTVVVP